MVGHLNCAAALRRAVRPGRLPLRRQRAVAGLGGNVDDVLLVEDEAILEAMRLLFRHDGLVSEPTGVTGLAAIISEKERFRGACVAIPICGGNLPDQQTRQWIAN
jgi:threonine dehydratase